MLNAAANRIEGYQGADTVDYTSSNTNVGVDLDDGTGNGRGYNGYAAGDYLYGIENAIGSIYGDELTGNNLANTLTGGGGNDAIDGMIGADRLVGGIGSDTYYLDNAGDRVVENAGASEGSADTVVATVSYVLPTNVEYLTLTGTSGIAGTGNALANRLYGNAGGNRLDGKANGDDMTGYAGNDTYVVDNLQDRVFEAAGAGADTVNSAITYTLSANVETLVLTNASNVGGTGNALDNTITGSAGANQLAGLAGADRLTGGTGADTFVYRALSDSKVAAAERDFIADFGLATGDRIDLRLIDASTLLGGDQAFSFIGNAAFSNKAGELRAVVAGGNTLVSGDINGNGTADFSIMIAGNLTMERADFLL